KQYVYDNPVGVMTNAPEFSWHLTNLNNYTNLTNQDQNYNQFGTLKVNQFDSGVATSAIPGGNMSVDRFVKAIYYSQYAQKAKTPDEAMYMLGHVMNNFDRPIDITMDTGINSPEGKGPSEFTVWTALSDLSRRKLFVRSYLELNYQQFDLADLSSIKTFKTIPYMSRYQGLGGNESQVLIKAK
ncbi:MAG: linear amide C-N hydrolase, partial [Synechocystis sp.]|nr:linear amide C-N hydrolase [Synechocystis sp.]